MKVSILMTAYNREKFIAEAIESVLASSYKNFELVIVDDCSKDNTVAIAKKYEALDPRVRVYVNEKNLDQFPNRNKATSFATGEIMVNVDSDDTIKADGIEYIVRQFSENPTVKFASIYGQPDITTPTRIGAVENVRKHFFKSNHLHAGPGGTIIKTDFFREIGGYPVSFGPAGDSYYNIKAACNTDMLLLPYIFFDYRIHGAQELYRKYDYIYYNYLYFEAVMLLPELPLSEMEKKKFLRKNKRNFLLSAFAYFKNTKDLRKTFKAFRLGNFGVKETLIGIFQ